jgi:hypothetical protein
VEYRKGASLWQALALTSDIGLGWKGKPGRNTPPYYENSFITTVRKFWAQYYKTFYGHNLIMFSRQALQANYNFCVKARILKGASLKNISLGSIGMPGVNSHS